MRASDADGADFLRAQVIEQFEHRAALGDLVVQYDHVLARDVADDGTDVHLVVGEALLCRRSHADAEQAGRCPGFPYYSQARPPQPPPLNIRPLGMSRELVSRAS